MSDRLSFAARRDPCELAALEPSARPSPVALGLTMRLLAGDASPEVIAWLRAGLLRWAKSDGSLALSEALHLSSSSRRFRQAVRNAWIAEAARYVGGSPWAQARALQIEAARLRPKLGAWARLAELPADASPVALCLAHGAIATGEPLPTTIEGMYAITNEKVGTR